MRAIVTLATLTLSGAALAQVPSPPSATSAAPSASASAPAPVSASAVPPGHPPIGDVPREHPAMDDEEPMFPTIPRDESSPDPSIDTGTIVATILDEQSKPVPNTIVTLGIIRTSVSEGESRTRTTGTTDDKGVVRFSNLKTGSGWAYRVSVTASAPDDESAFATYAAEPLQLPLSGGHRVLIHRFPVSTNLDKLIAAVEGVDTVVELRDDVIEVSQVFDVINASNVTWSLGKGLALTLPKGFKALRTAEAMDDHTAIATETGVRWAGSFPPGRSRLVYDFKVPYEGEPSIGFEIELPPRVLAARVRVAVRKGMELGVEGFPPAKAETTATGVKVLSTLRQGSPQEPIRMLNIRVSGIPTPGHDRWYVTGAALIAAALGFYLTQRAPVRADKKASTAARKRTRKALLADLVALERAHRAGDVGPKAYARERAKLVDAIADTLELSAADSEPRAAAIAD